jgi:hypothetical protein
MINFSARDKHDNTAAHTFAHGDSFGSHVTFDGLGPRSAKGEDRPIRVHAINTACNGTPSLGEGAWKIVFAPDPVMKTTVQLYNLDEDLGETTNLAAMHPERAKAMQATMEELITKGRSTPGTPQQNDNKVVRYPKGTAPAKGKQ